MRQQQRISKIEYADCPIYQYYSGILKGQIVTSKKVRIVYKYLYHLIADEKSNAYYDSLAADKAIDFIQEFCRQSKDPFAGQPIHLLLFQRAMLAAVFGIMDRKTGQRKFKELLLMIARKNGKSTLSSAIAAYMMFADGEKGAEIYVAATDSRQARIVWGETRKMIQKSPVLNSMAKCRRDEIIFQDSSFKPLSRDSKSFDGFNASLIVMDEIHAISDDELYGLLKQSQATRKKPLMVMITTAGTVRGHIFDQKYDEATAIIQDIEAGKDAGSVLPIIYELDDKAEIKDEAAWLKANPSLGQIKSVDYLREQITAAERSGQWTTVFTKDFNIPANAQQRFFDAAELINKEVYDMHKIFDNGYVIAGMDLSRAYDLTALSFIIKRENNIYVHSVCWMPERMYEKRVTEQTRVPWRAWKDRGLLRICEGSKINYHDIFDYIKEFMEEYGVTIYKFGYDSWSAQYFSEQLENYLGRGVLIPIIQGYKTLSQPMQLIKADFADKKIIYNANPLLQWCCLNAKCVEDRNGNMMPDKASRNLKIDAFAALLDAYAAYTQCADDYNNLQED